MTYNPIPCMPEPPEPDDDDSKELRESIEWERQIEQAFGFGPS